jgi:hypothetical protein
LTTSPATDSLLAEVFLNTRNVLIITNALLNPDDGNIITTALIPYLLMLDRFLENPETGVMILRELMFAVLIFYGIPYPCMGPKLKVTSCRKFCLNKFINRTRKYMNAETLALLTKPLNFPNMKYQK